MLAKLIKLTAAIGLALIVIGAEWAIWTDRTATVPGSLAITGIIMIILAVIIAMYVDLAD